MNSLLALALVACSAAPNPRRSDTPSPWQPKADEHTSAATTSPAANAAADSPSSAGATNVSSDASSAPATESNTSTTASTKPDPASRTPESSTNAATAPQNTPAGSAPAQNPAPASNAPSSPPPARAPATGVAIATVAGEPLDVRELVAQWVHHKSADALDELDHLVLTRLVRAEAGRLGIEIAPDVAQKAYEASVAQLEKEVQKRRPGIALDAWIDQVLGLDPYVYRERMRAESLQQLLAERTTRTFLLQSEHAQLRLIVLRTEAEMKDAQAALAKGEAFEEVAKRLSADPSSKNGGRVPPVVRADTPVARLAFQTEVGQVSEPLYNEGAWLIAKVEARPKPIEGNWSRIKAQVEASLAERGIEELEFTQWRSAMLRRYQVDISPFLKLAGQPAR